MRLGVGHGAWRANGWLVPGALGGSIEARHKAREWAYLWGRGDAWIDMQTRASDWQAMVGFGGRW